MNKLQRSQTNARNRMVRFRKRRKGARFTQMVTRKAGQAVASKYNLAVVPYFGTGAAIAGIGAELIDCFVDIPWYGQLLIGPIVGGGDVAFSQKVGNLIP